MNPRVVDVKPNPDYSLTLKFSNGEVRRFDVRPHLEKGVFQELKDVKLFNSVNRAWEASNGSTGRICALRRYIWIADRFPHSSLGKAAGICASILLRKSLVETGRS